MPRAQAKGRLVFSLLMVPTLRQSSLCSSHFSSHTTELVLLTEMLLILPICTYKQEELYFLNDPQEEL